MAFKVDTDGLLHVKARDLDTGVRQNVIFTSSIVDSGSHSFNEEHSKLEKRVFSLINRVNGLNRVSPLSYDSDFQFEIKEVIHYGKKALRDCSYENLWEAKISLESIVAELNAVLDSEGQRV